MNCPRCDGKSLHVTTERGSHSTVVRQFRCFRGHRFSTVEAYMPTAPVEKHQLLQALRSIAALFARKEKTT